MHLIYVCTNLHFYISTTICPIADYWFSTIYNR